LSEAIQDKRPMVPGRILVLMPRLLFQRSKSYG
jgi:hypothetical protein